MVLQKHQHQSFTADNNLPTAHPSPEVYSPEQILPAMRAGAEQGTGQQEENFITVLTTAGPLVVKQMARIPVGHSGESSKSSAEAMRKNASMN